MDMIAILASIMLVIGCLYLIISPFTQKQLVSIKEAVITEDDRISKQELYATLNEIEMDYKMNKLSEEDYQTMKKSYEQMVAGILQKEAKLSSKKSSLKQNKQLVQAVESEIDAELAALRKERKENS